MDVNEVDYIKIGQRIRAARMELGWQQAEVFSVKWKSSKRAPKCEHPKWHKK